MEINNIERPWDKTRQQMDRRLQFDMAPKSQCISRLHKQTSEQEQLI